MCVERVGFHGYRAMQIGFGHLRDRFTEGVGKEEFSKRYRDPCDSSEKAAVKDLVAKRTAGSTAAWKMHVGKLHGGEARLCSL